MRFNLFLLVSLICISLLSCNRKKDTLFELLPSDETGVAFNNTIFESDTFNVLRFEYIYNGGGVGVGDVNNDGLTDIYFSGNMVSSKLYLNKGNFKFEDITIPAGVSTSGWATGVSMVDLNQDGWLDIYVSTAHFDEKKSSPNLLFINNGPDKNGVPRFTEAAQQTGLADTGYSTQAAFFDYDRDGDLDMYLLTNALESFNRNNPRGQRKDGTGNSTDRLYRNDGIKNGTLPLFTNVSREAGILTEGWGLGIGICDFNKDGWPDVYAGNDFMSNDLLWINNGDGTFTNQIDTYLKHQSHNSMGTDIADINNDGHSDIVVLDMMPETNKRQKSMFPSINYDRYRLNNNMGYQPQYIRNVLQLNNGNGTFSEIGQMAGIYATDWSWCALFADYDNDGWRDLLITNGYHKDVTDLDYIKFSRESSQFGTEEAKLKQMISEMNKLEGIKIPNYIFKNNTDLTFSNKTVDWGMNQPSYSNGTAFADFDNDGDLDVVVNNINEEAFIYKNNLISGKEKRPDANYLQIQLKGSSLNKAGLGASIHVYEGGKEQFYEHTLYRGYKSTVENRIHFGLGKASKVDSLEITWPDGKYQQIKNIAANQLIAIDYNNAMNKPVMPASQKQPLFAEVSDSFGIDYKHEESEYMDFQSQPLLPHKYSQNGPGMAIGDMDNNGLEDFFVGGSTQTSGQLFYQVEAGKFAKKPITSGTKPQEDMGCLLFDADNDNDLDLYIVSGGSEYGENSPYYQDRLYKNTGKGNFQLDSPALPKLSGSGSCVIAADYDKDGDLDLFVGRRIMPDKYPLPVNSYILRNNNGKFEDVTAQVAPSVQNVGLVTAALWTDFDNDNQVDLIVTGEWMPIQFFKNVKGKFVSWNADQGIAAADKNNNTAPSLNHSAGWWNSLVSGDFDKDGDIDYVAGNLGLNSRYKASPEQPVSVVAKDFDDNGRIDPILCYYIQGKNYPTHPRDALIEQILPMRRKFKLYADYGKSTFEEIFTKEELAGAYVAKSEQMQSSFIENLGQGKFAIRPLPMQAQVAPVFGMLPGDFNADGNLDILLSGNFYGPEVQAGRYDASIGLYLAGDGKGNFTPVSASKSGFSVNGDAKGMAELALDNSKSLVLVTCNADSMKVFKVNAHQKLIKMQPSDAYAIITCGKEKVRKQEFYYGSSYLSQSSRVLHVPSDATAITIYDFRDNSRSVSLHTYAGK